MSERVRSTAGLIGVGLLTIVGLLSPHLAVGAVSAQPIDRDPYEIALTDEEGGGKDVLLTADENCSDDRARCVYRRWERDGESDAGVGPIITANRVWIARDVETAKAIYREQEKLQKEMPERIDYSNGPFPWEAPRDPEAEEWTGASSCVKDRCESLGRIDLHQRLLARTRNVVTVVYLYGRSRNSTPELAVYFTTRMHQRV